MKESIQNFKDENLKCLNHVADKKRKKTLKVNDIPKNFCSSVKIRIQNNVKFEILAITFFGDVI